MSELPNSCGAAVRLLGRTPRAGDKRECEALVEVYTADWSALPEEALLGRETLDVVKRAIEELPVAQRRDRDARHRGLGRR